MNFGGLVDQVAKSADMQPKAARRVLVEMLDIIIEHCNGGGAVRLKNFGRFERRTRAARRVVNPRRVDASGNRIYIQVPAIEGLAFVPAAHLRRMCEALTPVGWP